MTGPWDRLMSARAIFAIQESAACQDSPSAPIHLRIGSSLRLGKPRLRCNARRRERDLKAHAFRDSFMSVRYGLGQSDQNKRLETMR